jgi:transcriptional regulator with XRE-family HTH domain
MYEIDIAKLKEYIIEKHHTITAFAKAAGVSRVYVSRVLAGKTKPGYKLKIALLRMGRAETGILMPSEDTKKRNKGR